MKRLDRSRYEASVVSLSAGSAVRKLEREGFDVCVIDEPTTPWPSVPWSPISSTSDRCHPHPHVSRRRDRTKAAMALGESGHHRPYVVSTVHSSRVRSAEDKEVLRALTPEMTS